MKCLNALLLSAWLGLPAAAQTVYLTTIASLDGTNGAQCRAGLTQGANGNFYGLGYSGGSLNIGCVFEVLPGGTLTNLYSFTGGTNSAYPRSTLLAGRDGSLYGEMVGGGSVFGSLGYIFRISPDGTFTYFANFDGFTTGESPSGGLLQGQDGNFYGTSQQSGGPGPNFFGSIFQMKPDGTVTNLFGFAGTTNGSMPLAGLAQAANGVLYGTTEQGGTNGNNGTIFQITTNGIFTSLLSFNKTNGALPYATMIVGPDGNLYGTTESGGTNGGYGTVFRLTPGGSFTSLHSFGGSDGTSPYGGLVMGTNGVLYGTTEGGGDDYSGAIYQITTNGDFTLLYSFDYDDSFNYPDGESPADSLTLGRDGNLYGTTSAGGEFNLGTVFRLSFAPPSVAGLAFQSVGLVNGGLTFTWNSVLNASYQVQYITDLTQTNWTDLGTSIMATNSLTSDSDVIGPQSQRFYRVMLLP